MFEMIPDIFLTLQESECQQANEATKKNKGGRPKSEPSTKQIIKDRRDVRKQIDRAKVKQYPYDIIYFSGFKYEGEAQDEEVE